MRPSFVVSHQKLSLKFMQTGGHYHYSPTEKKPGSWTCEGTLHVKEVVSGRKHSDILRRETSFSCFAVR